MTLLDFHHFQVTTLEAQCQACGSARLVGGGLKTYCTCGNGYTGWATGFFDARKVTSLVNAAMSCPYCALGFARVNDSALSVVSAGTAAAFGHADNTGGFACKRCGHPTRFIHSSTSVGPGYASECSPTSPPPPPAA